jgi:hypothetical protein
MPRGRAVVEHQLVIVACTVSAGIHAALTPEHLGEGAGPGLGFLASAVLLAGLAVALTRSASQLALIPATAALAGLIGAYGLALTTGVPLLHPEAEPVEGLAIATKTVELVGLVAAAHLLVHDRMVAPTPTERTLA